MASCIVPRAFRHSNMHPFVRPFFFVGFLPFLFLSSLFLRRENRDNFNHFLNICFLFLSAWQSLFEVVGGEGIA